jgi:ABC-type transport system substrate-binding protein
MNRRVFTVILVTFAVAGALLFWQAGESPGTKTRDLVIAIQSPPTTIDPVSTVELDSALVGNAAHATLVRINGAGEVMPVLAKEIVVSSDGMSATISLKDGCKFWDGSPVTSRDVEGSLSRLQKSQNPLKFVVSRIKDFRVVSPLELVVTFSEPEPEFILRIANLQAAITKADTENSAKLPFDQNVIGAGAWIPEKLEAGARFRFRPNLGFPDHGNAASLTFVVKSDPQTRLAAFESGEANILRLRGPELREALEFADGRLMARKEFKDAVVVDALASDGSAIMINWANPVFATVPPDKRVAFVKVFSQNIPRRELAKTLVAAEPFENVVPPSVLAPAALPPSSATHESFASLFPAEVELLSANDAPSRELASLVAPTFRALGLNVKLRFVDIGGLVKAVVQKEHQFAITYFEMPIPGVDGWLMFFDEKNPFSTFGQPLPGVRESMERTRSILDPAARRNAWQSVVADVAQKQSGWIPLFSRRTIILSRAEVAGVFVDVCGTPVWSYLGVRQ